MSTTEYRPLILHVSHGSARGDVGQNGVAQLSLHTSVEALADGLLNLYRTDATAAQVLGEVLARLAGVTEYNAILGTDAERWNALILEQMEKVATLTRERDEARADLALVSVQFKALPSYQKAMEEHKGPLRVVVGDCRMIDGVTGDILTTPTPGAQA